MKKLMMTLEKSFSELKSVKTITICGLMAAIAILLGSFAIQIGNFVKIGFSEIPNEIIGSLFGPTVSAIFAATLDILKFMLNPTGGWIPGLTLDAFLAGFIYGISFYKKNITFKRILITKFIVVIFINTLLGTFWLAQLYGSGYIALLPTRIVKNLIMWPINSILFWCVLKGVKKARLI